MQQHTRLSNLRLAQSGSNPSDHAQILMTLSFFQTNPFHGEGEDGHDMLTSVQAQASSLTQFWQLLVYLQQNNGY
jgi:hypothetical protein